MKKDWIRLVLVTLVLLVVATLLAAPVSMARSGGGGVRAGGNMKVSGGSVKNVGGGAKVASGFGGGNNINNKLPGKGTGNIGAGNRFPANIDRPGAIDPGFGVRPPLHRPGSDINVIGGGYYPWYNQGYAYPVYVPVNYGGDANACYQACVASGQYTPEQCAQMCYQPY